MAFEQKLAAVPPPSRINRSSMAIRNEVQNIFTLNQTISKLSTNQSAQIQSVQGQARTHQKILNELEAAQEPNQKTPNQKTPNKKDLLAQEKLRSAHEEAQRNAQMTDELNQIPAEKGSEPSE